jgi:hypothetical protein
MPGRHLIAGLMTTLFSFAVWSVGLWVYVCISGQARGVYSAQRNFYLVSVLLVPVVVLLTSWVQGQIGENQKQQLLQLGPAICVVALVLALYSVPTGLHYLSPHLSVEFAVVCFAVPAILFFSSRKCGNGLAVAAGGVCLVYLFYHLAKVYIGDPIQNGSLPAHYFVDFNANTHSIVQSLLGQLPVYDYFSQYGYYGAFLFPLRGMPITLASLVSVLGLLIAVSLFLYAKVLRELIGSFMVWIFCFGATLYTIFFVHSMPYWANLPIRFLPAVLVLLLVSRPSQSWVGHVVAGLAPFWSTDSGVIALIAWVAVQAAKVWFGPSFKIKKMLISASALGVTVVTLAFYLIAVGLLRGGFVSPAELFRFHDLYFVEGIVTGLIPIPGVWMAAVFIYFGGMTYFWSRRHSVDTASPKTSSILFLSLYGFGMLSYYFMRGHASALLSVIWPMVVIVAYFSDRVLASLKGNARLGFEHCVGLVGVSFLWLLWSSALAQAWGMESGVAGAERFLLREQLEFVTGLSPEKPLLILSDKSALFYGALEVPAPLQLPGATEIALLSDIRKLEQYLAEVKEGRAGLLLDRDWTIYKNSRFDTFRSMVKMLSPKMTSPDDKLAIYW